MTKLRALYRTLVVGTFWRRSHQSTLLLCEMLMQYSMMLSTAGHYFIFIPPLWFQELKQRKERSCLERPLDHTLKESDRTEGTNTSWHLFLTLIREFIDIAFSVPPNEKFRNFLAFRKGLFKVVKQHVHPTQEKGPQSWHS